MNIWCAPLGFLPSPLAASAAAAASGDVMPVPACSPGSALIELFGSEWDFCSRTVVQSARRCHSRHRYTVARRRRFRPLPPFNCDTLSLSINTSSKNSRHDRKYNEKLELKRSRRTYIEHSGKTFEKHQSGVEASKLDPADLCPYNDLSNAGVHPWFRVTEFDKHCTQKQYRNELRTAQRTSVSVKCEHWT